MTNSLKTMSTSQLHSNLAGTLKESTANSTMVTITHWHKPTHLLVPVNCLTSELRAMVAANLLPASSLPQTMEVLS